MSLNEEEKERIRAEEEYRAKLRSELSSENFPQKRRSGKSSIAYNVWGLIIILVGLYLILVALVHSFGTGVSVCVGLSGLALIVWGTQMLGVKIK
jgi:hypothetical protein